MPASQRAAALQRNQRPAHRASHLRTSLRVPVPQGQTRLVAPKPQPPTLLHRRPADKSHRPCVGLLSDGVALPVRIPVSFCFFSCPVEPFTVSLSFPPKFLSSKRSILPLEATVASRFLRPPPSRHIVAACNGRRMRKLPTTYRKTLPFSVPLFGSAISLSATRLLSNRPHQTVPQSQLPRSLNSNAAAGANSTNVSTLPV